MTTTITFCECAENHVGMEKIGTLSSKGYTLSDLKKFRKYMSDRGIDSTIYNLKHNDETGNAYILVAKTQDLVKDINLDDLDWDTKAKIYGRVVNKRARHNLCFADYEQEPDYENNKGRVINFQTVPELNALREFLRDMTGDELVAEGNRYYDKTCGIGYHGDAERKKVIGVRFGEKMPLVYQWYHQSERVGDRYYFDLEDGDLYIMCEKATGNDWKKKTLYTLRHAAGSDKYIQ